VVTYVAGALTELTRIADNRELFFNSGGVQALLKYQMSTNAQLIVNVNNAIANCALHASSLGSVVVRYDRPLGQPENKNMR